MDSVSLLRAQFAQGHQWLEGTIGQLTDDQLHWCEAEGCMPISAQYAHTVLGEDYLVHGVVRGGKPLMMGEWGAKLGVSEPPPMGDWGDWATRVRVDLGQLRQYAQAVYAETDAYIASLSDSDLDRQFDSSPLPFGITSVATVLSIMGGHVFMHAGEISTVKGLQGLQGYPEAH